MANTRKVLDVKEGGKHFAVIIQGTGDYPYYVYRYEWKWQENKSYYEGGHWHESRNLVQKCADMKTALLLIAAQY